MSRYNLRSKKNKNFNEVNNSNNMNYENINYENINESLENNVNVNEIPYEYGRVTENWVMDSYDTFENDEEVPAFVEPKIETETETETKSCDNSNDYSYNGYTWCEDYKDSTIYPNYDWVTSIADEWTHEKEKRNTDENSLNSYITDVTDDTIDIDENNEVNSKYNNASTNTENYYKPLNFNYHDSLFIRKSLENIEFLSISDVFRYVTLGNVISYYDFKFLQTDICRAVYGDNFEYPEDKMISIYTNFNNYMIGEEPQIIKIIPFHFRHYRKIAKVCLDYAKDNNKYCVSLIN